MPDKARPSASLPPEELSEEQADILASNAAPFCEADFLEHLRKVAKPFLHLGAPEPAAAGVAPPRKFFRLYTERSLDLEIFLDECLARANRKYAPLREYVASVRGFARAGQHLTNILRRMGHDLPQLTLDRSGEFTRETEATVEFVRESLEALWREVARELERLIGRDVLDAPWSPPPQEEHVQPRFRLPADMDQTAVPEQNRRIAELASKFLAHKKSLEQQGGGGRFTDPGEMRKFVQGAFDEQQVRFFQTRLHNLLSGYDTFVQGTAVEGEDSDLSLFRGFVTLVFILLELTTELVHFYERHENDIRSEQAKGRVAQLVSKERVIDRVLNYGLFQAHRAMEEATPLAERLIQRYTRLTVVVCPLPGGVQLHARPVSLITRIVEHYSTPVSMTIGDTTCHAGSMLQVLMAAGANPQVREVRFVGDRRPLEDLHLLFEHWLGEKGRGTLPKELSYLGY